MPKRTAGPAILFQEARSTINPGRAPKGVDWVTGPSVNSSPGSLARFHLGAPIPSGHGKRGTGTMWSRVKRILKKCSYSVVAPSSPHPEQWQKSYCSAATPERVPKTIIS